MVHTNFVLFVQTSGKVYLEQNLMLNLILRSVWSQFLQNRSKTMKNRFPTLKKCPIFLFVLFDFFGTAKGRSRLKFWQQVVLDVPKRPARPKNLQNKICSTNFRENFRENSSKNSILQIFRTRRTLGDIENYASSKFQPRTTLGGTKHVKKTQKTNWNFSRFRNSVFHHF